MAEKTRYSDEELQEFKELILKKLDKARKDYELLKGVISGSDGNDIADTSPTFKVLEEGAAVLSKEEAGRLAQRQPFPAVPRKYILYNCHLHLHKCSLHRRAVPF